MNVRMTTIDGRICNGECKDCEFSDECSEYNGKCMISCENCSCWSGGCEAGLYNYRSEERTLENE